MLSKSEIKRLRPEFEVLTYHTARGKEHTRAMPRDFVPIPVAVGMAVEFTDANGAARTGKVLELHTAHVVVLGQRGELVILLWGELKLLGACRPE